MPVRKHLYQQVTRLTSYMWESVVSSETITRSFALLRMTELFAVEGYQQSLSRS